MNQVAAENRKPPVLGVLLLGGITFGTLDILFAKIYWDAAFPRVFRSVARGWLGESAQAGGASAAWLGAASHYFITTCMVIAYYVASRRLPVLTRRPVELGLVYGVFLYFFMNLVVLPLSAAGMPSFENHTWVGTSILMHALFGVICSFTAKLATGSLRS